MAKDEEKQKGDSSKQGEASFEELMKQAEEAVKKLESGKLSLEQSLEVYENGVHSVKKCREILSNMELRIKKLVKESNALAKEDVKEKFES